MKGGGDRGWVVRTRLARFWSVMGLMKDGPAGAYGERIWFLAGRAGDVEKWAAGGDAAEARRQRPGRVVAAAAETGGRNEAAPLRRRNRAACIVSGGIGG